MIASSLGVGGCRQNQAGRVLVPPDFMHSDSVPIQLDTQATVHDEIRIGLGFVSKEDFIDVQGRAKNGLVAGLWIYVRGDSSQDQVIKVHVGQRLNAAEYRFFVEAIEGGKAPSILLRVLPSKNNPKKALDKI